MIEIHFGDNLPILRSMPEAAFDLIYIDPPFNTGKAPLALSARVTTSKLA